MVRESSAQVDDPDDSTFEAAQVFAVGGEVIFMRPCYLSHEWFP